VATDPDIREAIGVALRRSRWRRRAQPLGTLLRRIGLR
jgi:hypothetical protein